MTIRRPPRATYQIAHGIPGCLLQHRGVVAWQTSAQCLHPLLWSGAHEACQAPLLRPLPPGLLPAPALNGIA